MEELLARHRKEIKDLQGRITSKKKNATKKTRRGVNDECAELERALKKRHAAEAAEQSGDQPGDSSLVAETSATQIDKQTEAKTQTGDEDIDGIANLKIGDGTGGANSFVDTKSTLNSPAITGLSQSGSAAEDTSTTKKKLNRQKARLARRAAEQEAAISQAEQEAQLLPNRRREERATLDEALKRHGLVEHEVRSDGHCLYAALADQLALLDVPLGPIAGGRSGDGKGDSDNAAEPLPDYKIIRQHAAEYVLAHQDDFLPFLDEEDMLNGIDDYARRIRDTGEWGGQLEILACARNWGLVVNVLQGDGRVERIEGGPDTGKGNGKNETRECWLVYYRHSFGLGEHYNSLHKAR